MSFGEIEIVRYEPSFAEEWDAVVRESRNATFLLERRYMDYHADRFEDYSLILRNKTGRILGLMAAAVPKNSGREVITAHPGLTYGGLILPYRTDSIQTVTLVEATAEYFKKLGFKYLKYRPIPHIYHRFPSEDDVYALIRHGAVVDECLLSSTISLDGVVPQQKENTRRNIAKANKNEIIYRLSRGETELRAFYEILSDTLLERHSKRPVHTFDELRLLMSRFPDNIKLWIAVSDQGEVHAGIIMFLTDTCAHTQYIAASKKGFETSALFGLIDHLVKTYRSSHQYFDFGNSNEDHGMVLNHGLIRQKSGFGARGTTALTLQLRL